MAMQPKELYTAAREVLLIMCAGAATYLGIRIDIERHAMQIAALQDTTAKIEVRVTNFEHNLGKK